MKQIDFIKYNKIWVAWTILITVGGLILIFTLGLKPGIDFTGGSLLELSFSQSRPDNNAINQILVKNNLKENTIQKSGDNDIIVRTNFLSEVQHQKVLGDFKKEFTKNNNKITESRFETIGAAVSQQLRNRAIWAIVFVVLSIVIYVAYAFRKVSRPVASWKYGVISIVAVLHDILLVLGVFAILGKFGGVEVSIAIVVALLTILGYSINDTIVVFDRIRENLLKTRWDNFGEVVNNGLNQTLMRSLNTTLTTLLPLFALYFAGGATIHYFSLALLIGIASGAYSSIFIASPLLVIVEKWGSR